jgi:hypothetical protein
MNWNWILNHLLFVGATYGGIRLSILFTSVLLKQNTEVVELKTAANYLDSYGRLLAYAIIPSFFISKATHHEIETFIVSYLVFAWIIHFSIAKHFSTKNKID